MRKDILEGFGSWKSRATKRKVVLQGSSERSFWIWYVFIAKYPILVSASLRDIYLWFAVDVQGPHVCFGLGVIICSSMLCFIFFLCLWSSSPVMVGLFFIWIWVWCSTVRVEDPLVVPPFLSLFISHGTQLFISDSRMFFFFSLFLLFIFFLKAILSSIPLCSMEPLVESFDFRFTTWGWQCRWFYENDAPQEERFQAGDFLMVLLEHPVLVSSSHSFKTIPERKFSVSKQVGSGGSTQSERICVFQGEHATVDPKLVDLVDADEVTICVGISLCCLYGFSHFCWLRPPLDIVSYSQSRLWCQVGCAFSWCFLGAFLSIALCLWLMWTRSSVIKL